MSFNNCLNMSQIDETDSQSVDEPEDQLPEQPGDAATDSETDAGSEATEEQAGTPEERIAALEDQLLRAQAEVVNMTRRTEARIQQAHQYANQHLLEAMLPVLDNMERAQQSLAELGNEADAVRQGVALALKSFTDALERFGVVVVNPVGEAFNPVCHEALSAIPSTEVAPGRVIEVVEKGYMLNERLLRAARVVIAQADSESTAEAPEDSSADSG